MAKPRPTSLSKTPESVSDAAPAGSKLTDAKTPPPTDISAQIDGDGAVNQPAASATTDTPAAAAAVHGDKVVFAKSGTSQTSDASGSPQQTPAPTPPPAPLPPATQSPSVLAANGVVPPPPAGSPPALTANIHVAPQDPAAAPNLNSLAVEIAAKSQSGAKQFDIRLDPPELGRVDVRLSIDSTGKVEAHMTADQPQTLDMLQKDSATLTQALRDAGLNVTQDGLNFSLKGQDRQSSGSSNNPQPRTPSLVLTATKTIDAIQSANFLSVQRGRRPSRHSCLKEKFRHDHHHARHHRRPPPTTNSRGTASANDAMSQLSGNFSTFLTLLTTQLKNQDPLSPMDSNSFTQQLVEFSQVEQQIDTNSNLKSLIGQGTSQAGTFAANYLGKQVSVTNGNASLTNGAASWTYNLGTTAAATTLTVTDASGNAVYTQAGATSAGNQTFNWNGKSSNGNQLADGTYKLTVAATAADGSTVTTSVASSGTVTQVDMTSGTPKLVVGNMEIRLSDIANVAN